MSDCIAKFWRLLIFGKQNKAYHFRKKIKVSWQNVLIETKLPKFPDLEKI